MRKSLKPLTTTLIGGVVFLLPLIVVIYVLGQGLALTAHAVQPVVALLPDKSVGGITLASAAALALLLLVCFGAGLLARAAAGQAFAAQFEDKLLAVYPRYSVIKAMSQGLHGAVGKKVLKPVLVSFDDNQIIGFDMERLDDGRVVLYVPGAPDAWSGNVQLVAPERVQPLDIDSADLAKALQGLGLGIAGLMRQAAGKPQPRIKA